MAKSIRVKREDLQLGLNLLEELTSFRPYSSISFLSSAEILNAAQEAERITSWGMAKNKHKMKASACQTIKMIASSQPEEPVNLNLSEYEMKSLSAARDLLQNILSDNKDGVILV